MKQLSFTGWQAGNRYVDDEFSSAKIEIVQADRIREELERGAIVVVAGFQGLTHDGDDTAPRSVVVVRILTAGRFGVRGLDADVCEIDSDVDGIYTATRASRPMRASSMWFPTMICLELFQRRWQASPGDHARLNSRVNTRWSFIPVRHLADEPGTVAEEVAPNMEHAIITGIAHDTSEEQPTIISCCR